jgi:L-iditol 2-dehydrogenase
MQFGGKVFIIGVGKNEQVVCFLSKIYIRRTFESLLQFPFMHLSANEIDVQFQYRYANQVSPNMPLSTGRERAVDFTPFDFSIRKLFVLSPAV